jgi:dipeptidyl aminopeptidase/acylaminoacyl peptidase
LQAECADDTSRRFIGLPDQGGFVIPWPATNGVGTGGGAVFQREPNMLVRPRAVAIVSMDRSAGVPAFATIADGPHNHRRPTVSPDGRWIAWQSNAAGEEDDILLARIDGSERRNLTDAPGNDGHPWFSADGRWLVFESDRTGNWEIWRIELDTGVQTRLTFGGAAYSSSRARPR